MSDIEIIRQIEKELNLRLKSLKTIDRDSEGYTLNQNEQVTGLSLYFCNFKALEKIISHLKNFKSLTTLELSGNKISDISHLKDLKNITELNLGNNQISDVSSLKDLKNLTTLNLNNNQISVISFLKDLKSLTKLNLQNNKISNISPLKELKNLTQLNLYGNQIGDIFYLKDLNSLTSLDLSKNQIRGISYLKNLKRLTSLQLSENKINDISSLKDFSSLTLLKLNQNQIDDISPLKELINLTELDLSENRISDIFSLKDLKNLTSLYLSENQITESFSLKDLNELKRLNLRNNQINNIDHLKSLFCLTWLNLRSNQISDISPLNDLINLNELYLSNNQICILSPLIDLKRLSSLYLDGNKIHDISPLKELNNLMELNISENKISNISLLKDIYNRDDINIYNDNNPIKTPPIEIVQQGKEAVRNWFVAQKKKLNEIKVLLVGEAKAGKTSLLKLLKDNTYNPDEQQTDGIIIEEFDFSVLDTFKEYKNLHGTKAYFWDFGGQEIMKSTHQFFMTNRSIYILLLESRRDGDTDNQVKLWLRRIETFGGNSQVIIVANKIDLNRSFGIDITSLSKEFPQIIQYIPISCKNNENIEILKSSLQKYIPKAELFETEIDEKWIEIKEELQKATKKEKYISQKDFEDICIAHKLVDIENQHQAIKFLNDLGIVLHFDELTDLSEYFVLDPYWVTTGVYRIITSDLAATQNGKIDISQLSYIVNEEKNKSEGYIPEEHKELKYTKNELRYIADIMAYFKLSFYYDEHKKILIPDLLNKTTPLEECEVLSKTTVKLGLIYNYNYLPNSVIPRLIVEMNKDIKHAWRTGCIFSCCNNITANALVTQVENDIVIIVTGEYKQKREYLSVIRFFLDNINSDLKVKPELLIPLPGYEEYNVKHDVLLKMERKGFSIYTDWELEKEFEISLLLEGITKTDEIRFKVKEIINSYRDLRKIYIFLASSKELKNDREKFEQAIHRKNILWTKKGIFLEPVMWENFIDSISPTRLQDEYNKAVKKANIFVMLFFSKVGKYTLEEFENACEQFKKTGENRIYTYFKNDDLKVSSLNRKDTLSLFDFQDKLKELGHFSSEYTNPAELILHFFNQLDYLESEGIL